jgi:CheY-like chemotaxis protein
MDRSTIISCYLPSLRRYSRAISGSQKSGDAAVLATLQSLLLKPSASLDDDTVRIEFYRALLDVSNGPGEARLADLDMAAHRTPADTAVACMSPLSRQAFLLTAMEGFTREDASEAMRLTLPELERLLEIAHTEISAQSATDVLIIEDEVFIAREIASIVRGLGHRIYAQVRTHTEAMRSIRSGPAPGLILADICLADGSSGIDAANEILVNSEIPTIFITAYPERLLTGQRPEPAFLISKPFAVQEVRGIISQVLFFKTASRSGLGNSRPNEQGAGIITSPKMLQAG